MNYKITYKTPKAIEISLNGPITSTSHLQELTRVISEKEEAPIEIMSWEELPSEPPEPPEPSEPLDPEVAPTTPVNPEPPETVVPRIPEVAP